MTDDLKPDSGVGGGVPPAPLEYTAWLVELNGSGGPTWWTGRGDEFTPYVDGSRAQPAFCAIRFARQEDAERAIGWLLPTELARGCKASEHLWLGR